MSERFVRKGGSWLAYGVSPVSQRASMARGGVDAEALAMDALSKGDARAPTAQPTTATQPQGRLANYENLSAAAPAGSTTNGGTAK